MKINTSIVVCQTQCPKVIDFLIKDRCAMNFFKRNVCNYHIGVMFVSFVKHIILFCSLYDIINIT